MKKIYILMVFLMIIGLVTLGTAAERGTGGKVFKAWLSGAEVAPPAETKAKGEATFELSKDGNELYYRVTASDIENVTAAHIHKGKMGENGPPLALIKLEKKAAKGSEKLGKGEIGSKELMTSLTGKSVRDLVKEIEAGNTYVNVHTTKFPDGEIRGQIK